MDIQKLLLKAAPEIIEIFEKRYTILKAVYTHQPIGRRTLASLLQMGERIVRSETGMLKDACLIEIKPAGMVVTPEGEAVLDGLSVFAGELRGFHSLEQQVAGILNVQRVVVVPGSIDEDPSVISVLGRAAAGILGAMLTSKSTVAVTGGSSVGAVANTLTKTFQTSEVVVIPARGGIGKEVEFQSNTIAAMFAKKLGGQYRLLHLPDQLTAEAAETLLNDPDTRRVIEDVKGADILVCGIGRAQEMAAKRNHTTVQVEALARSGAVAEAFGYYFNRRGEIIFSNNSIGLHISDLKRIPQILGAAGGREKAEAIMAVLKGWQNCTLVTDEAAAREILSLSGQEIPIEE